jgi:hypothetical protein
MPSNKNNYLKKKSGLLKDMIKTQVNPHVYFDEEKRYFKIKTEKNGFKLAKGLVPSLRSVFYNNYKFEQSKFPTKKKIKRDIYGGQIRGSIVHKQLMMYANKYSVEEFKKQYLSIHPYSIKAFRFLKINEWIPIIAELPVADPDLMIATAIDMICINTKGEIILIEWKTGMDNYMLQGTQSMDGPIKDNNCPLNQAHLQLLFGKIFLEKNHGIKSDKEYVVQIKEEGVVSYSLPKEYLQRKNALYNYLSSTMVNEKKKSKSKFF